MVVRSRFFSAILLTAVVLLAACDRQPSIDALRDEISSVLADQFRPELFEILSIRRMGSSPYRDKDSNDRRLTVYFNAQLVFREDFDLTSWDGPNTASLAFLLGATEKGIDGVRQGGNRQGEILRVHGSRVYALRHGEWRPLLITGQRPTEGKRDAETPRILSRINELAERAARRFGGDEQALIERELSAALKRIERAMDQLADTYGVASGPIGGAYHRYIQALEDNTKRTGLQVRNHATQGSVENCQLVQSGGVDFVIAQGNIAGLAAAGEGLFDTVGRQTDIRAISALFPEYLHVVVADRADIDAPTALRGKRVDVGLPESRTRVDALRLLDALGLQLSDFSQVSETGLNDAIKAMQAGKLDAFITTLQAPGRALQNLFARGEAHLLSLSTAARETMADRHGVYRRTEIAAHTYPNQPQAVGTLSVTAMLIARSDLPDTRVQQIMEVLFSSVKALARHNLQLTLLSRQTAREGVSIPLHPAAEAYLSGAGNGKTD